MIYFKMRKAMLLALIISFNFSCGNKPDITKIMQSEYEISMISSGDNRPAIPYTKMKEDKWIEFMVLLHHQTDIDDIKSYLNWNDTELNDRIQLAMEYNYLKKDTSGKYRPTLMVISLDDGAELQALAKEVAKPMSEKIISKISEIKSRYKDFDAFKNIPFEEASFLILSDVLLDNWQIRTVENRFLQSPRTLHHGKNYYYSFMEKVPGEETEPFGIYGNMMSGFNNIDNLIVGIYGNKRKGPDFLNLTNAADNDLRELFGMSENESVPEFKKKLVDIVLRKSIDPEMSIDEKYTDGFNKLGWMNGTDLCIPVLDGNQNKELHDLATIITEDLLELLTDNQDKIRQHYDNSIYSEEITQQEYTIWWYHFFYTEVTNILKKEGFITVPSSGNTYYILMMG